MNRLLYWTLKYDLRNVIKNIFKLMTFEEILFHISVYQKNVVLFNIHALIKIILIF